MLHDCLAHRLGPDDDLRGAFAVPPSRTESLYRAGVAIERVRWPVSRVLSPAFADGWPFLWDACRHAPHATYPGGYPETDYVPPLFGLAPGGACLATPVAGNAVRSYRTISTLPRL